MTRGTLASLVGKAAAAALPALFLLTSCAVTDRDVVAQQGGRLDDLQVRLLRLERTLDEMRGGAGTRGPALAEPELNRRVADLGQRVDAVEEQLRAVGGRMDELRRSTASPAPASQIPALEAALADLSHRVETLERRPATALAPAPVAGSAPPPTPLVTAPLPAAPLTATPGDAQTLYDSAYTLYKQGKYDAAREAFRKYIEQFPDTPLTDNAYFWVGESYYDQRQYEQAILEYDKVVQKFPKGDKVPGALLKQAFAFDAIGDPVDARILLKKILREHPSSEQAAIAKKKLEILGE